MCKYLQNAPKTLANRRQAPALVSLLIIIIVVVAVVVVTVENVTRSLPFPLHTHTHKSTKRLPIFVLTTYSTSTVCTLYNVNNFQCLQQKLKLLRKYCLTFSLLCSPAATCVPWTWAWS